MIEQSFPTIIFPWSYFSTWWLIPLSKWVITPVINGISTVNPLITGVITHLLSGMSHQVPVWVVFFDAASGITCGFWAKTHQENAPPQLTFINETHPPILPPVRDGDSDSTTTPGTDFPWKYMEIGETGVPGFKWTLGCPGHFPYLGTFDRVWAIMGVWEVPWLGVAESPSNEILKRLGIWKDTLWLCQNSYWKWPFIVSFTIKMVIFHNQVSLPEGSWVMFNGWCSLIFYLQLVFVEISHW